MRALICPMGQTKTCLWFLSSFPCGEKGRRAVQRREKMNLLQQIKS